MDKQGEQSYRPERHPSAEDKTVTPTTLDGRNWERPSREQADEFREVQIAARKGRWFQETEDLKNAAMRLARQNGKVVVTRVEMKPWRGNLRTVTRYSGGFTAPEMTREAGLEGKVPYWLPGATTGWLSDAGWIQVGCGGLARENSSNGSRKGAKICRWELSERAIARVPEPRPPGVPTSR